MAEYTTMDAVQMAYDGNAAGFREAISDLLMDKVYDAVAIKKHEVAANFMSTEDSQEMDDVD